MDNTFVTISASYFEALIMQSERCNIIERMLERGLIVTESTLKAILDIEVEEDGKLSI